jgi:Tol biopolymer transport system component/DNA-binding winged helix-turn-helix (wHTH) protein
VTLLAQERFQIGEWAVAPKAGSIAFNGKTVRLEPKVMQVLVYLASANGDVVTKEDLARHVWSEKLANDEVLKRSIAELRRAFDDDPKNPSVIETIPNFGYRLVAPVDLSAGAARQARAQRSSRVRTRWPLFAALGGAPALIVLIALVWLGSTRKASPSAAFPLTAMAGFESNPSFSPDGRQVAFDHADEAGKNWNIYVQAAGETTARQLTFAPGSSRCPAWSPDGKNIAFTRRWETRPGSTSAALAISSPQSGEARDLMPVSPQNNCVVAWSADSRWLAFSDQPAVGAAGIFVVSLADRKVERLSTAPTGSGDEDPAFSPDGTLVAFARRFSPDTRDLYVVERDGTELRRVTSFNSNLGGPVWEADGKHLLFWKKTQHSPWSSDLYRVSATGSAPERLQFGSNDAGHVALAGKARRLAFVKNIFDANIWKISLPEKPGGNKIPPAKLDLSSRVEMNPAFSPDGKRLAFVSDREGSLAIWVANPDGSGATRVVEVEDSASLSWSPDASEIAYASRHESRGHIYTVNLASGQRRQVTHGSYEDASPSWSADGKWIYFASPRSGQWNIWKVPTTGGEPVQVTTNRGVHPVEAPNGRHLYYAKPADPAARNSTAEVPGIWRISTSGGTEELVLAPPAAPDGWFWTVSQKGLYFVSTADRSQVTLKLYNFASRRADRLANLEKSPWGGAGLAVSPDGLTILYSQVDAMGSDVMVVENYR